jgi:hypothetical protein
MGPPTIAAFQSAERYEAHIGAFGKDLARQPRLHT